MSSADSFVLALTMLPSRRSRHIHALSAAYTGTTRLSTAHVGGPSPPASSSSSSSASGASSAEHRPGTATSDPPSKSELPTTNCLRALSTPLARTSTSRAGGCAASAAHAARACGIAGSAAPWKVAQGCRHTSSRQHQHSTPARSTIAFTLELSTGFECY